MKQISEETIENIKKMLRDRNSYLDIKSVLDNLEDSPEQSEGDAQLVEERSVVQSPSPSGDAILKDEICKTCGFPKSWERNPVFIKDDIFSLMNVEENTCKECGHQADGWTIKKIQPLLKIYREDGIKDILKDLKDLRNHHGKSSITNGDLDTIINRYVTI